MAWTPPSTMAVPKGTARGDVGPSGCLHITPFSARSPQLPKTAPGEQNQEQDEQILGKSLCRNRPQAADSTAAAPFRKCCPTGQEMEN